MVVMESNRVDTLAYMTPVAVVFKQDKGGQTIVYMKPRFGPEWVEPVYAALAVIRVQVCG